MPIAATHHNFRQAHRKPASPLWWFVSLSLLLHLALLLEWQQSPVAVAQYKAAVLAVHLVERQQPNSISKKTPAPPLARSTGRPRQAQSTTPQPISTKPAPRHALQSIIEPDTKPFKTIAGANKPATEPQVIGEVALQSSLKVTLRQELARHFNYPLLARRRGWEGEVLLAFRLEADGRITGAHVARSSGYGVLDRAALTALGKVKRILSGAQGGFAMELPVIYRLEG